MYRFLQNTIKNNIEFLTMKLSQGLEVYNFKNRGLSSVFTLNFRRIGHDVQAHNYTKFNGII